MRIESFDDGVAACVDSTLPIVDFIRGFTRGDVPLIVTDPPYGNVVDEAWDKVNVDDVQFSEWMLSWTKQYASMLLPNAAFYVWGGVGRPGFRPFFRYLSEVEGQGLLLANLITWSKRRAYGVQHNYLFTREELAYLINGADVKKPRTFNVPLLEAKRGYAGYNPKYPAKSDRYRRTNVWTDVNEIFRGKLHVAQKPQRLIEVPIEVHTSPGEWVLDPFAGSGTTAFACRKLGRRFCVIERDEWTFDDMVKRLRAKV